MDAPQEGTTSLTFSATHAELEKAEGDLLTLQVKQSILHREHRRLKHAVRKKAHKSLEEHHYVTDTAKTFAETCMGTIAGWITATTCHQGLVATFEGAEAFEDPLVTTLVARIIFAVFTSLFVPIMSWTLHHKLPKEMNPLLRDQVRLAKVCLPMFFAWSWKDLVSAILDWAGRIFWPELLCAVIITAILILGQAMPVFKRSQELVSAGGQSDTPIRRIVVTISHLGLAVGYAWNSVCSWVTKELISLVEAPVFVLMIQVIYFAIISGLIIFVNTKWSVHVEASKANEHEEATRPPEAGKEMVGSSEGEAAQELQDEEEDEMLILNDLTDVAEEFAMAGRSVVLNALHFVYAWAQLDTVNALIFVYLLECTGPTACTYQSNFLFSFFATIIFNRMATMLKLEKHANAWNQTFSDLTIQSLSLNAGWAWANYCQAAIANAQSIQSVKPVYMYLIFTAFAWLCMTALFHRFEVERRSWVRTCKEDAENLNFVMR